MKNAVDGFFRVAHHRPWTTSLDAIPEGRMTAGTMTARTPTEPLRGTVGTTAAADLLAERLGRRVIPSLLNSLIRNRRLQSPRKNSSGGFEWAEEDLARAAEAIGTDRRFRRHRGPAAAK
jgi:hypothetical protein